MVRVYPKPNLLLPKIGPFFLFPPVIGPFHYYFEFYIMLDVFGR